MNVSLASVLQFFHDYGPLLLPVGVWLLSFIIRHLPSNRFSKLQQLAAKVIPAIEQQANGTYTNEQKYEAASKALTLLAARFGYRVNEAEVRLLIEGAVSEFKSLKSSTSAAPPSPSEGATSVGLSVPNGVSLDFPTQSADAVSGAV